MIEIIDKDKCCGCGACTEACPKRCITMVEDKEGFPYPKVDKTKCINCNLCNKVCPILNKKAEKHQEIHSHLYATYSKDEGIRKASSSGGIFSILAEQTLKHNGIVIGAAFDEKFEVRHYAIDNINDLKKLRGSKYVQSLYSAYSITQNALSEGKEVLYSGTPCQIEGLYHFLNKKDTTKLLTVDFVCHGVPSPKVWRAYVNSLKHKQKSEISSISFREKNFGWRLFHFFAVFRNGRFIKEPLTSNPYLLLFLGNVILRPSCYNCKFKKIRRVSDITLADYWGIWKHDRSMYDNKGTSMVIIHSTNGKNAYNSITSFVKSKKEDFSYILNNNNNILHSSNPHPYRDLFLKDINRISFDDAYKRFSNRNKLFMLKNRIKTIIKYLMYYLKI